MASRKRFILFDFDGVIADSYNVAYSASRKICARVTDKEYRRAFEGNVNDWDRDTIPGDHSECHHDLDWFEEYVPAFEDSTQLFEGVREVIETLSKEYILIVISSTITSPIQGFLEKNHLGRFFSEVMGNDVHTHKTEKMDMVFEKYKVPASHCVFITDSLGDMKEANEKSVGSVGVLWGWHSRETLEKGNPFRLVEKPAEIHQAVSDYFAQKSSFLS